MTTAKFTPGPWQTNGSHIYGPDPERELVAQAHGNGEGAWSAIGGSTMCANKYLIAAAPEMYEALVRAEKKIASIVEVIGAAVEREEGRITPAYQLLKDVRSAIAKAQGGAA